MLLKSFNLFHPILLNLRYCHLSLSLCSLIPKCVDFSTVNSSAPIHPITLLCQCPALDCQACPLPFGSFSQHGWMPLEKTKLLKLIGTVNPNMSSPLQLHSSSPFHISLLSSLIQYQSLLQLSSKSLLYP